MATMIIHALLYSLEAVLVGRSPSCGTDWATIYCLAKLASFPKDSVLIIGDFNMILDPGWYRMSSVVSTNSDLIAWADTFQLVEIWR